MMMLIIINVNNLHIYIYVYPSFNFDPLSPHSLHKIDNTNDDGSGLAGAPRSPTLIASFIYNNKNYYYYYYYY